MKEHKKRAPSRSPNRQAPLKKARRVSTSPSNGSRRSSTTAVSVRGKSVFRGSRDPYFPRDPTNPTSLPTGDDWGFRIQVVSESTDIHTEMFKKAVQGLVKICFPQNVLNELRIDVVQQHMHEQHAPTQNIERMCQVFRSEMVHRLVWMLAEYLDDTSKVEAAVKSVTAASAVLHGNKLGLDILGNVVTSIQQLRSRIPENSTKVLANDTVITEFASDTINDENSVAMSVEASREDELASSGASDLSESETEPLVDVEKRSNKKKVTEPLTKLLKHSVDHRGTSGNKEKASNHTVQPAREGKEIKVSTSWRWNIQQADVTVENIQLYFHRTVDLYAYHALPVAKSDLGHDAGRKDIRLRIESMWTSMNDDEYEKWVESFRKLKDGDLDMVERVESTPISTREGVIPSTPAPVTVHKSHTERTLDEVNARRKSVESVRASDHEAAIKQEVDRTKVLPEAVPHPELHKQNHSTVTSSLSSHYSTVNHNSTLKPRVERHERRSKPIHTPIVDLLWGNASIDCEIRQDVVRVIMERVNQRIPAEFVEFYGFDGRMFTETKSILKNTLLGDDVLRYQSVMTTSDREYMEKKLTPWVVVYLPWFPELKAEPCVFVHIMTSSSIVLDSLCGPQVSMCESQSSSIQGILFAALRKRGILHTNLSGPKQESTHQQIIRVLRNKENKRLYKYEGVKRGFLEQILRHLVFENRKSFPELKSSVLVKTWEKKTGQQWY